MEEKRVIVGSMEPRRKRNWNDEPENQNKMKKRLRRNHVIFAAVSLCTMAGLCVAIKDGDQVQEVMHYITAGFEYDDTLGRLQFVSNILPESAMVFLEGEGEALCQRIVSEHTAVSHPWSGDEPWIEYVCFGDVSACGDGEISTIVKNHANAYTVRVVHDHGCESIYSGLNAVQVKENMSITAGEQIGTAAGTASFEWRKNGLSVQPVFSNLP